MKAFFILTLSAVALIKPKVNSVKYPLPPELKELSGLAVLGDSLIVAHNDGGNDPNLFFLTLEGKLKHQCEVEQAKNVDWEDLAFDGAHTLYIGDFGNNGNKRKNLKIYAIDVREALISTKVQAQHFSFEYPQQTSFPPEKSEWYYDCEGMAFYEDSLYLFTKCRTEPWSGISKVYSLSVEMKDQKAHLLNDLYIGKSGWWQDAVTGVDIQDNVCYVMTYDRINIYKIKNHQLSFDTRILTRPITQKEGIAVDTEGVIYVGDERSKLLAGGNLIRYTRK